MKRLFLGIALALALVIPSSLWAAAPGTCVHTPYQYGPGSFIKVTLVCTAGAGGDISTQTMASATMTALTGYYYLFQVIARPTTGGTAPDAADIQVLMDGMDLLGGKGANLINATTTQDTFPYSTFMSSYRFPAITNTLTLTVANQATNAANYTIDLVFVR